MYSFWLFLHITSISIWAGSSLVIAISFIMLKKHLGSIELSKVVKKMTRMINFLVHSSALFVLISGVFMMMDMNFGDTVRPFYIAFMERFGGGAILFSLITVSLAGRKLVKKLTILEKEGSVIKHLPSINMYIAMNLVSVGFIVATIFVVSFRF
ncbi:hypothetical protein [Pseudogracilibacillus auburnensis]|uniref:hypothetical protein n=1 Tax=Pseudogracilibacillus auburnensis TaxID=1494959 RepID=UPI001A96A710|nr:hypothetical protein [Pseudogracilibacillus auburnensis]MBO1005708.1 hypothetical protein [Pseudogracilibacillus auburnensis]